MNKNSKVERIMKIVEKCRSDSHDVRHKNIAGQNSFDSESSRMNLDQLRCRTSYRMSIDGPMATNEISNSKKCI